MDIRIIKHGTPSYTEMVELRREVLRKPLGLDFTQEQLDKEKEDVIVAGMEAGQVVACCILTPHEEGILQLRQMAVSSEIQSKGRGRAIVEFAESWAMGNGYHTLMMHARDVAIGFYEKCGYSLVGEGFTEVGIAHHLMVKKL
ncbi:MAG: GNAT family N-acetyltransferase [Chitinophagales bacterium]|nr:GNAT family N-acetyltransferase [Chitinophagales bacterium]